MEKRRGISTTLGKRSMLRLLAAMFATLLTITGCAVDYTADSPNFRYPSPIPVIVSGSPLAVLIPTPVGSAVPFLTPTPAPTATLTNTIVLTQGSASSPSLSFTGDSNTGIYSGGANQFQIVSDGVARVYIDTVETTLSTNVRATTLATGGGNTPRTSLSTGVNVPDVVGSFDNNALTTNQQTAISTTILNDPKTSIYLLRKGAEGSIYGPAATINLSRFEDSGNNSRTRVDFSMSHGAFSDLVSNGVLTLRSDGLTYVRQLQVGNTIGTTDNQIYDRMGFLPHKP